MRPGHGFEDGAAFMLGAIMGCGYYGLIKHSAFDPATVGAYIDATFSVVPGFPISYRVIAEELTFQEQTVRIRTGIEWSRGWANAHCR
jgi:hypothetical protein